MKTTFTRFVLAAALAVVSLCAAPVSAAPLTITFSPMPVIGAPGDEVVIDVTVENTTGFAIDNLSINDLTPPNPVGIVDTSWFDTGVLPLAIGGVINSTVHFLFDPAAPLAQWESFELEFVYDLVIPTAVITESSFAGFRAQAQPGQPVPEPVTMSLFGIALAGAAIARRRRA